MKALGKFPLPPCILHGLGYLALAAALAVAAAFHVRELCGGELIPPLDDTYIYLQYARAAAAGDPFVYQPGMEPTRGATSLLYPFLLAPWARLLAPEHLFWAAWALGILFLAGTALAADRWAARVLGPGTGWWAGALVLASGHVFWGALSGMEIGLTSASVAACLALSAWYLAAGSPREGTTRLAWLGPALLVLGLARPEGILLGTLIAALLAWTKRAPNSPRARWILILAPVTAAALTAGANLLALGTLGSNTLESKAFWSEPRPDVLAGILRGLPVVFLRIVGAQFTDFHSHGFGGGTGRVLAGLLALGGVLGVWRAVRRGPPAVRILLAVLLAGILTTMVPVSWNAHHFRYQIPFIPLVLLLVLAGWQGFLSRRPRGLRFVPAALILVLLLPGLWKMGRVLGANASNILDHQVTTGRWIRDHLPPGSRVAINDAGAIAFYGGYPVVDLVGLVTNGSARAARAGTGAIFEWLEELPPEKRPTHFAVFPAWLPYLKKTSLMGRKLAQFTLGHNTISGAEVKAVFEADWSHVETEDLPRSRMPLLDLWGFSVSDQVDVDDLQSQAAHDYRAFDTWRDTLREFPVVDSPGALVIDGGRQPTRGERFRMRCRPGEPGALVMRTEAYVGFELEVRVNGRPAGLWKVDKLSLTWSEPLFEIPGELLDTDEVWIEVVQPDPERPYPSFHYWLLQ